jgi:preprotein translocase YajC subunit
MPQSKQAKKRKEMIEALAVGNKVETVSRVFGTITEVNGEMLTILVGVNDSTKIRIHREGVARVVTDEELSGASNKEISK